MNTIVIRPGQMRYMGQWLPCWRIVEITPEGDRMFDLRGFDTREQAISAV